MNGPSESKIILSAEDLHKSYLSGQRRIDVLQGISLSISESETISIRGESGSGKSTLLNLLAGIETPETGEVSWNGESLGSLPESRRPKVRSAYLGFVFQSFYLIPELNLLENVLIAARIAGLPMREARDRANQLLEELGLLDRLQSRPDQLSGGERQRTAIARSLINHPEVLLADEPTGNLDEHTAERVIDQLMGVVERHKAALVLVTHHPGFAARAEKQFRLEDGRLV